MNKETIKTIALAAIVSGVVCFIFGVHYQEGQQSKVQAAVQSALKTTALAPAPSKN